ncbi:MAG: hypothetical protein H6735_11910 [Alphaproteobacteria bacterium]|nr:hypothetical protein [Alphaproteobacteria bacterium]
MGRRIVVTTLLGAAVACGHKDPPASPTPEPPVIANPPPPEPMVGNPPAPEPPPEPQPLSTHDLTRFTRVLNGKDAEERRILRRSDGTCYVNLPLPPAEGPPISFRPPPQQDTACPPHMSDASWDACLGTVQATEDLSECACLVMGNPPPPPRRLDACPTAATPEEP